MADDLGFNDVSFRGSNEIPTYNIDALAYGGIILDRFYTPAMCTPSRAALLTGKYPQSIGMQDYVITSDEPFGLGLDQKIMPQYFKEVGYKTHLIGKWHQGFFQQQYWPTKRGFDSFFGYLGAYIGYHDHSLEMMSRNYSRGYDLRRNLEVDRSYGDLYATDMFTKEAVNVIQNHDDNEPLFLLINHLAPHAGNDDLPLEAKLEDYEKFSYIENEDRRTLAAMVYSLDESVGEIVEALTDRGIMNDTIIIFYSDNGGPSAFLHATTASNYPLRSQKESGFEGGIRTDAFIYAPWLPSGVIRRDFFYVADFLPSLSTLANANIKIETSLDGIDLSNMITKGISPYRNEVMTLDDGTGYSSLILNGFKYVNGSSSEGMADGWLGSNKNNEIHSEKYLDGVLNSKVAKLLNIKLNSGSIQKIRKDVRVNCAGIKTNCDLLKGPCLFDIINDPCEENNLYMADTHKSDLQTITNEFNERLKKVVPSRRKKSDPRCNPANFNNTWHFWQPDVVPNGTRKVQRESKILVFMSIVVGLVMAFRR